MFDQDAWNIDSVSEIYPTAVVCVFCVHDSFHVGCRFWLHCHISKKLWTLAILCNFLSSATLFISMLFSVVVISNVGLSPANVLLLCWVNCIPITFSRRFSHVVFNCLWPIRSHPKDKVAPTSTPCVVIENISRATWERSVYFECVSSC